MLVRGARASRGKLLKLHKRFPSDRLTRYSLRYFSPDFYLKSRETQQSKSFQSFSQICLENREHRGKHFSPPTVRPSIHHLHRLALAGPSSSEKIQNGWCRWTLLTSEEKCEKSELIGVCLVGNRKIPSLREPSISSSRNRRSIEQS